MKHVGFQIGKYWSPNNPETIANYRSAAGLPAEGGASGYNNSGEFLAKARVRMNDLKYNGPAKPCDGNPVGGIVEYIWKKASNFHILWNKTLNPPY